MAASVVVFAPAPILTVTIEEHDGAPDIHLHAGGQGVWQARMVDGLGPRVTIVGSFAGETGQVARHLLEDEGFAVHALDRAGIGPAYIHDRRTGEREEVVETAGDPLSRHDLDELYGLALRECLGADLVLLSGPNGDILPADVYRRLAADLREAPCRVMVDLAGDRLTAALAGGVDVVKVSHEELEADGLVEDGDDDTQVIAAMRSLAEAGAGVVIVTRAGDAPALVLSDEGLLEVAGPRLEVVDPKGAGDSLTAAVASVLAEGGSVRDAVVLGAAAGALNVTRRGLGSGDPAAVRALAERVTVRELSPTTGEAS